MQEAGEREREGERGREREGEGEGGRGREMEGEGGRGREREGEGGREEGAGEGDTPERMCRSSPDGRA